METIPNKLTNDDIEYIQDQSARMEWNTFPLDRQLPVGSVWKMFKDEYKKVLKTKEKFSGNKNQRLREGYFSLFVAVAKSRLEQKEHWLAFPKDPKCDAHLLSVKEVKNGHPTLWNFPCDVKEYTSYSPSFLQFLGEKVVPRLELENYNIIIGIHADISDPQPAIDLLKQRTQKLTVWLVSNTAKDEYDIAKGRVIMVFGDIVKFCDIDLSTEIPQVKDGESVLIFQNYLRDKLI